MNYRLQADLLEDNHIVLVARRNGKVVLAKEYSPSVDLDTCIKDTIYALDRYTLDALSKAPVMMDITYPRYNKIYTVMVANSDSCEFSSLHNHCRLSSVSNKIGKEYVEGVKTAWEKFVGVRA